jgi:membrane fusion protein, multidrug efflux system
MSAVHSRRAPHGPLFAFALAASALLASATAQAQQPPQGVPVQVAKPVVRELVETTEFSGRFEAVESVSIRSRVGGYLSSLHFQDGAIVKAGDLLFTIDRRPYEASVSQAEAAVASARTALDFARGDFERFERLSRTGVAADRTLDQSRQQFLGAQANLQSAQAQMTTARLNLEFTQIRAPIGGKIGRRLITEGNLVNANETMLTTIVSADPIHFYFDIDERTYLALGRMAASSGLPSAASGDVAVKLALADEREFNRVGKMDFVDNRVDRDSGTVRVRAIFENRDLFLSPGLFGRVAIPASPLYRAILIPDEAIAADLDRRYVWVIGADGNPRQQPVRTGPREFGYRLVRQGLTGDETIVVSGLQRIRPGVRLAPQQIELPQQR